MWNALQREKKKVRGGRRHKKLWSSCVRWRSVEIIIEWAREWQAVKQRYGKKWKLIYVWKFTLLFSDTSVFFFALRLYNFTLMIRLKWYHFAEKTFIKKSRPSSWNYLFCENANVLQKKGIENCSSDSRLSIFCDVAHLIQM